MEGLSCYTANLHAYLEREFDADAIIAPAVRLAMWVGLPDDQIIFSQHEPLRQLPDGTRLHYASAESPNAALSSLRIELERHGAVLVVVDASQLPWSVVPQGLPVPHWLLLHGREGEGWVVADHFTAVLPTGRQEPCAGQLSSVELLAAMNRSGPWTIQQRRRDTMAFGDASVVPSGAAIWLRRSATPAPAAPTPGGRRLSGDGPCLRHLVEAAATSTSVLDDHLEDLWAASGHHVFALRWRMAATPSSRDRAALASAARCWEELPRLLRVAAESARRGRPRPRLVVSALSRLLEGADR